MAAGVMHARAGIAAVALSIVPDIEVRASNRIGPRTIARARARTMLTLCRSRSQAMTLPDLER
eukprot:2727383-Prymnesium_polylepis.1